MSKTVWYVFVVLAIGMQTHFRTNILDSLSEKADGDTQ